MAKKAEATQVAPWRGSNVGLVAAVLQQIPARHRCYYELFAGGLSVLLAKVPAPSEYAVDLNPDLANLVGVLSSPAAADFERRVADTLPAEHVRDGAVAVLKRANGGGGASALSPCCGVAPDAAHVEWAWAAYAAWWMGRGGDAGGERERGGDVNYGPASIRHTPGGNMASRWAHARAQVSALRARLSNVMMYRRSAFEVLPLIRDRAGTVVYADPPFIGKERLYRFGWASAPSGGLWRRDQHTLLAEELGRFVRATVVVRYYEEPRLADLYPADEWRWVRVPRNRQMNNGGGRVPESGAEAALQDEVGPDAPEVLLVRRPRGG